MSWREEKKNDERWEDTQKKRKVDLLSSSRLISFLSLSLSSILNEEN
jgi:hypothetical protein